MVLVKDGVVGENPKCSAGTEKDPCSDVAGFAYTWEWGEQGQCCQRHVALLQQSGQNLGRSISFAPLAPRGPEPITRDERVKLKAEVYALEEELKDAKAHGLELYRVNEQLRGDNQLLKVHEAEAANQLRDAKGTIEELRAALQTSQQENGSLLLELERAKTLAAFAPRPPSEPDQPNVVE